MAARCGLHSTVEIRRTEPLRSGWKYQATLSLIRRPPPPARPPAGQDRRRRQPGPHAADPARGLLSRPPRPRAGPAWKPLSWPAAAPARPSVPCPEAPPAGVPTPARLLCRQAVGAAPPFPSLHRSPPLLKVNPLLFPVDPCWIVHPCSCVKDI